MKLSLSTPELLMQLQATTRVASSRASIQALSGVMISADGDTPVLLATDMEVGLRVRLQAEVASPGTSTVYRDHPEDINPHQQHQ